MRVVGQNVPSNLFSAYCKSLKPAFQKWNNRFNTFAFNRRRFGTGPDVYFARKRSPWRIPHMQNSSLFCPSIGQLKVRRAFKRTCNGFNQMDKWLDWIDIYGIGPASRADWFRWAEHDPLWYYNYLMSILWRNCYTFKPHALFRFSWFYDTWVGRNEVGDPDTNYSDETTMKCGYNLVPPSGSYNTKAIIYITKRSRYSKNKLSCLYLKPTFADCGIIIYATLTGNDDPRTMTWNDRPQRGPMIASYTVAELNSGLLLPIADEDKMPNLNYNVFNCIEISFDYRDTPLPSSWGFHGAIFKSMEYPDKEHASLCP